MASVDLIPQNVLKLSNLTK